MEPRTNINDIVKIANGMKAPSIEISSTMFNCQSVIVKD